MRLEGKTFLVTGGRSGLGAEVAAAALERLRLFGVPEREIARLEGGEKRKLLVPIESPIGGFVIAKTAIQGMYVTPEVELYQIADLSRVWLLAELYEYDLPVVSVGDEALVTLTYEPQRRLRGRITYIYPEVTGETRTVRARIEVDNPGHALRPGQYANVEIEKDLGDQTLEEFQTHYHPGSRGSVSATALEQTDDEEDEGEDGQDPGRED